MTTATTVLALLPVFSSTGRASDVMVPMAIPSFGGMLIEVLTTFAVPVPYSLCRETRTRLGIGTFQRRDPLRRRPAGDSARRRGPLALSPSGRLAGVGRSFVHGEVDTENPGERGRWRCLEWRT